MRSSGAGRQGQGAVTVYFDCFAEHMAEVPVGRDRAITLHWQPRPVASAVFMATGKRLRQQPFRRALPAKR